MKHVEYPIVAVHHVSQPEAGAQRGHIPAAGRRQRSARARRLR